MEDTTRGKPRTTREKLISELRKIKYSDMSIAESRSFTMYLKDVLSTVRSLKKEAGRREIALRMMKITDEP